MDSHSLVKLAHMFYKVWPTIVKEERRLMEMPWKFSPLDPASKGWLRNLTKRLVHDIISYAFPGWTVVFSSVMRFFVARERFTWRSSWPSLVTSIIFTTRGATKTRRRSLSLRMCERPRPRPVLWCWAKPTWMGGVVLLPLKMEVRLVIFSPLD